MKKFACIGILALGLLAACDAPVDGEREVTNEVDREIESGVDRVSVNHLAHDVARCWAGAKAAVANQDNYARQDCTTARNRSVSVLGRKNTAVYRLTDDLSDAVYALNLQRVDQEAVSAEDEAFRREARGYSLERINGAPIDEAIREITRAGVKEGADPHFYEQHIRKLILNE